MKPTFAFSRLTKKVLGLGTAATPEEPLGQGLDGGDSSTPSLTRWLGRVLVDACLLNCRDGTHGVAYPLTAGIVFSSFCDASFACVLSA